VFAGALVFVLGLLTTLPAVTAPVVERRLVGSGQLVTMVRVEDVQRDGDMVRFRLVNQTPQRLENLRVLITESFRWTDERHPGADDPGRAVVATVPGPLAPGASTDASVHIPPRPVRTDGWFVLRATVIGLDAFPAD
jgi:hypothetical protein